MTREAERRVSRIAVLCTALAAALFLTGTYLAPLLQRSAESAGEILRLVYAPACHQIPERSFEIDAGRVQAVCARCAGLYWGGIAGLIAAAAFVVGRRRRPRPIWLAIAVAPTVIDGLMPWVGLEGLPMLARHVLAWPAGFVAGLFLAIGVADLAPMVSKRLSGPKRHSTDSILEGSDG